MCHSGARAERANSDVQLRIGEGRDCFALVQASSTFRIGAHAAPSGMTVSGMPRPDGQIIF
jgi:hypothetical protein